MKLNTSFVLNLLLTTNIIAAAPIAGLLQHQDKHQQGKRDMVVVTEYVNENGAVIVPANNNNANAQKTSSINTKVATLKNTDTKKTTATNAVSQDSSSKSSSGSSGWEDGQYKCSEFPSFVDGVISVDWIGLNGWSSIQDSNGNSQTTCEDGMYCSYACSAGKIKTQWPESQPGNGASLGGLLCKDGYLYRSNTASDSLCEDGTGNTEVYNESGNGNIAMCRTDYPGSENMVIPTVVGDGSSVILAGVDQDSYYQWQNKKTSAQYYVNNAGVSMEDGCVWGSSNDAVGNWAPLVIGSGTSNGKTYISLIPNPNNQQAANFNVKIVATDGSSVQGDCKYENGQFSSGSDGCTSTIESGSAKIVFY